MKSSESKDEVAKAAAAAKADKEKKDAMANIDINNYASMYTVHDRLYYFVCQCHYVYDMVFYFVYQD